ncbi:TPA: YopX family protein [Campylobacter jejuni]
MKLKDFDFRLLMSKTFVEEEVKCQDKECQCAEFKSLIYDNEAILSLATLAFEDNEAQIELFTGFKDSKGIKIYEGDIIECRQRFNQL